MAFVKLYVEMCTRRNAKGTNRVIQKT